MSSAPSSPLSPPPSSSPLAWPRPWPAAWRTGAALASLLVAVAACSGSRKPAATPPVVASPYSPEAAVLFDDVFAPAIFGFDPEGRTPAKDPKLKLRTRQADFVLPVRVETVSRVGGVAHRGAYEIVLAPAGAPLAGQPGPGRQVVRVPSTSASYSWVDGAGPQWVGSRVLLFGRRFQDGNATALHFRCEPDTPEIQAAVRRDAGLRLLR